MLSTPGVYTICLNCNNQITVGFLSKESMKKYIFILFVTMAMSLNAKEPNWKTFNDGIASAQKSGKKVIVSVYADWCKWCKKMDAVTFTDKAVLEYLNKNYVVIKLNGEGTGQIKYAGESITPTDFVRGMGINGFPATVFLKTNGEPITVLPGYSEPKMFSHVLSFIGENHYEKKKFDQYLSEKGVH